MEGISIPIVAAHALPTPGYGFEYTLDVSSTLGSAGEGAGVVLRSQSVLLAHIAFSVSYPNSHLSLG